ncbi:MAG: MarR family winged helix-turn-helix transcriptional regulator [Hyphomicrobiaceae bacterium]
MREPDDDDAIADLPLEKFLTYRLLTLTNRLNRQAMQILDDTAKLRLPEWRCLAMIGRYGKISLNRIAEITEMDRALISRSVQGLVEKGHVLTERDGEDRRVVYAVHTKLGTDTFQAVLPLMQRRQKHLLNRLSPSERKAIYRIIERLSEALDDWDENRGSQ